MSAPILRDLVAVLGGVRIDGKRRKKVRQNTRRRSRLGRHVALEMHVHEQTVVAEPEQWRAARRFVKNSNVVLSRYYVRTPFGHVALRSMVPVLHRFRERAMAEAAARHNSVHREWQVLVELTWADLGDDARSELLTHMAEDLPESFFERQDPG